MKHTADVLDGRKEGRVSSDEVLQSACRDVATYTNANRVSIWHFEKQEKILHCDCCFDVDEDSFSSGQRLASKDCPKYFKAILTEQLIIAPDARRHSATDELTDTYFVENDICSLLDLMIHEDFKPMGVICCENGGSQREWRDEDISYLRQMGTLISFNFKRDQSYTPTVRPAQRYRPRGSAGLRRRPC